MKPDAKGRIWFFFLSFLFQIRFFYFSDLFISNRIELFLLPANLLLARLIIIFHSAQPFLYRHRQGFYLL